MGTELTSKLEGETQKYWASVQKVTHSSIYSLELLK